MRECTKVFTVCGYFWVLIHSFIIGYTFSFLFFFFNFDSLDNTTVTTLTENCRLVSCRDFFFFFAVLLTTNKSVDKLRHLYLS